MLHKNKSGQAAETITWLVATLAIIGILLVSIFVASLISREKSFRYNAESDLIAKKSLTSFLLTPGIFGEIIFNELKSEEALNDFNGDLSVRIFRNLYENDLFYSTVWFGINFEGFGKRRNDFFGYMPSIRKGGDISLGRYSSVSENITLNENKWLELILLGD